MLMLSALQIFQPFKCNHQCFFRTHFLCMKFVYILCKKSLAQEVRQKSDILERRSKLTLFATRPLGYCATCKGSSYTKNVNNFFYQKSDAQYFLLDNFFKKSSIFRENREKLFWKLIWRFFRERRRLASKINITFIITNKVRNILLFSVFFKKICIFWENGKKLLVVAKSLLKGRGWVSADESEYYLFHRKCGFEYFFI